MTHKGAVAEWLARAAAAENPRESNAKNRCIRCGVEIMRGRTRVRCAYCSQQFRRGKLAAPT